MIYNASSTDPDSRMKVLDHLKEKRYPKVIDIGASRNPWARPYVTHCVDMFKPADAPEFYYVGDLCDAGMGVWIDILSEANKDKFDFAICTQTLEDLRDPQLVLWTMAKIAKRGYIDVPNKLTELHKTMENCDPETERLLGLDNHPNRGFMHHRWIFTIRDNKLVLYPKLGFIDRMTCFDEWVNSQPWPAHFLSFWWETDIPFETWNNDYLGPNGGTVVDAYRTTLLEGL